MINSELTTYDHAMDALKAIKELVKTAGPYLNLTSQIQTYHQFSGYSPVHWQYPIPSDLSGVIWDTCEIWFAWTNTHLQGDFWSKAPPAHMKDINPSLSKELIQVKKKALRVMEEIKVFHAKVENNSENQKALQWYQRRYHSPRCIGTSVGPFMPKDNFSSPPARDLAYDCNYPRPNIYKW